MRTRRIILALAALSLLLSPALFSQKGGSLTPQQKAQNFTLTVRVNAKDATVFINGAAQKASNGEQTSGNFRFDLPAGSYNIDVSAPGYARFSVSAYKLSANQTLNVNLVPDNFNLSVNANVKGAQVSLSNGMNGQAGQTFSLPGGNYTITVSAPGYNDFVTSVQLSGNQVINANLMAALFNLTVNANVGNASILIDGNAIKGNSVQLPAGGHSIVVRAPGYMDFSTSIQLNGNQVVNANLAPMNYNLTVNSNVKGAQVSLSNGLNGQTGQTFSLPGGNYTITVSAPGYQAFSTTIQLSGNQVVNAELMMMTGTVVFDLPNGGGIQITIDGGKMNSVKGNNFSIALPPGPHKVKVDLGSLETELTINVNAGQTLTITPVLSLMVK